ncbi:MAG: hypothetical protein FD127_3037 [Acidimicrobiaceae bacterium]|nr:MAG: hypothetical protein FD127_3037 [Acidimicrobiaceae bacterium]
MEEPGDEQEREDADEELITAFEASPRVAALGLFGPGVVERRFVTHPTPYRHEAEGDEEGEAHRVEHDRVDPVEGPLEEAVLLAEEQTDDVFVDRQDDGADEQSDETPQDEEVGHTCAEVAFGDAAVRGDHVERVDSLLAACRATTAVLGHPPPPSPCEDRDRDGREHVEHQLAGGGEVLEDLARLALDAAQQNADHPPAFSVSSGSRSNRSTVVP